MPIRYILLAIASLSLTACATNPVTGESELRLTSQAEEVQQGQRLFPPTVQMEGGPYTADSSLQAYVEQVGMKLVAVSDRKNLPYEFVVVNNMTPNAWALPGGKIGVNTGLLVHLNSEAELAAVLSHEIVHAAAGHGAQQSSMNTLSDIGLSVLNIATLGTGWAGVIAQNAAGVGSTLVNQNYSRDDEAEADHYGMLYMAEAGYNPEAAVELQRTFLKLSENQSSSNWLSGLFASHPPSQERLDANQETAKKLSGGVWNKSIYQQKVAALKRSAPAYTDNQKGLKALKNNQPQQALQYANQAIKLQPNESKFYSLRGLAYLKLNNRTATLQDYNTAVAKNPYYFINYLERGLLYKATGDKQKAIQDLQASQRLLPTKTAEKAYRELTGK